MSHFEWIEVGVKNSVLLEKLNSLLRPLIEQIRSLSYDSLFIFEIFHFGFRENFTGFEFAQEAITNRVVLNECVHVFDVNGTWKIKFEKFSILAKLSHLQPSIHQTFQHVLLNYFSNVASIKFADQTFCMMCNFSLSMK